MPLQIVLRTRRDGNHISQSQQRISKKAVYMRNYRKNIKEKNSLQYKLNSLYSVKQCQKYRKNQTEEQRKRNNEKAKIRMRRLREKKAAMPAKLSSNHRPSTRSIAEKVESQREYWRQKKKNQRNRMTEQKKRRIREKDRERKRRKHLTQEEIDNIEVEDEIESSEDEIESSEDDGDHDTVLDQTVQASCHSLKGRQKRVFVGHLAAHLDKCHGSRGRITRISRKLNISYSTLMKYKKLIKNNVDMERRKPRSDATSQEKRDAVLNFYKRPDVSTVLPNKKCVNRDGSTKHVLQRSLKETHKAFVRTHEVKIGRSKFAQLRPKNVLPHTKAGLFQCLCEKCTNIDLKLKSLQNIASTEHLPVQLGLRDRYYANSYTLCPHDGIYQDVKCVERQCKECGTAKLAEHLKPLMAKCQTKPVSWRRWGRVNYGIGGTKKRVIIQRHEGTVKELVDELLQEMTTFSQHLFQARWQQQQFCSAIKNVLPNELSLVMDFSENFICTMQREVQSAHWFQQQITLHPMVAFYNCNNEACTDSSPVRESIHIISSDMKHDAHAVACFISNAVTHLKEERGLKFHKLIEFSDGCAGQFKGKTSFADLSFGPLDLHVKTVERHFFGASHGKNPCDGEGGLIKSLATRAIKAGPDVIISDSTSFYKFCKENLSKAAKSEGVCSHSRRTFIHIAEGEVERNRPGRTNVATVKGTRRLHAVRGVSEYTILTRRYSCFCHACMQGNEGACYNSDIVGPWKRQHLKKRTSSVPSRIPSKVPSSSTSKVPSSSTSMIPSSASSRIPSKVPSSSTSRAPSSSSSRVPSSASSRVPSSAPSSVTRSSPSASRSGGSSTADDQQLHPASSSSALPKVPYSVTGSSQSASRSGGSSTADDDRQLHPTSGDFVMVRLPVGKGKRYCTFVAEVKRVDGSNVCLSYMEDDQGRYRWPHPPDVSTEPLSHVVKILSNPVLMENISTSRNQYFSVSF